MTTDFMTKLLAETKQQTLEAKGPEKKPTLLFQIGYVAGAILVAACVIALEAVLFSLLLLAFGYPFLFWQGLAIAAAVQLLSFKFKANG